MPTPEEKDAEIGRLHMELKETQDSLAAAEARLEEIEPQYQMRISGYKKDFWGGGKLPVPRLQMHYEPIQGWSEFDCIYSLVYRHRLGHVMLVPMGITRVGPSGRQHEGPLQTDHNGGFTLYDPFRDGVHIRSDSRNLNLPAFRVHGDRVEKIEHLRDDLPIEAFNKALGEPVCPPRWGPEGEKYRKRKEREEKDADTEE